MPDSETRAAFLSCLEVWGGSDSAYRKVVMRGLDAWVFSQPYRHAPMGGDVYYVSSCATATSRMIRLLIADVSGHGSGVVEPAAMLRTLMRRYVNQFDQRRFVRAMNSEFCALSQGGLFATAVVATYFASTHTLTLTNAGHPPPALYDAHARAWSFLEAKAREGFGPTDVPLGVLDRSEYEQHALHLRPGNLVLCYTDSLLECRDAQREHLGREGLKSVLNQLDMRKPDRLIPALLQALRALHVRNLKEDDVTALLFTPNALSAAASWVSNLRTRLAAMKKIGRALLSKDEPVPWPDLHPANLGGAVLNPLNKLWGRKLKD